MASCSPSQLRRAGSGTIDFTADGSEYASVATGDGQAIAIFGSSALKPARGESSVTVTLAPLDPATLAPARRAAQTVTVVLRYLSTGTRVLRLTGSAWTALGSTAFHMSLQTLADSDSACPGSAAALRGGASSRRWALHFPPALEWIRPETRRSDRPDDQPKGGRR